MKSLRKSVWTIPVLLFATSIIALILALLKDGVWDWFAWGLLAMPLLLVSAFWFARKPSDKRGI